MSLEKIIAQSTLRPLSAGIFCQKISWRPLRSLREIQSFPALHVVEKIQICLASSYGPRPFMREGTCAELIFGNAKESESNPMLILAEQGPFELRRCNDSTAPPSFSHYKQWPKAPFC
jgi:hypothetical protein